jgi:hypothetical protein
MNQYWRRVGFAALLFLPCASAVKPDVSVRECINQLSIPGKA